MWEIVVIAVVVVIAAVLVFAATRPDSFGVERTASIGRRPTRSFRSSMTSRIGAPGHPTRKKIRR